MGWGGLPVSTTRPGAGQLRAFGAFGFTGTRWAQWPVTSQMAWVSCSRGFLPLPLQPRPMPEHRAHGYLANAAEAGGRGQADERRRPPQPASVRAGKEAESPVWALSAPSVGEGQPGSQSRTFGPGTWTLKWSQPSSVGRRKEQNHPGRGLVEVGQAPPD